MFTKRKPIANKKDMVGVITSLSEPTVLEILVQASVFQALQAAQKRDMRTKKWTSNNSNSSSNNNNNDDNNRNRNSSNNNSIAKKKTRRRRRRAFLIRRM